jgi:hypothetical protein
MPAPRPPKNEPPAVTIRWQRRQMIQMEQIIAGLRQTTRLAYLEGYKDGSANTAQIPVSCDPADSD